MMERMTRGGGGGGGEEEAKSLDDLMKRCTGSGEQEMSRDDGA